MQRVIAFMRENVRVNKTINVCSSAYHQWTCSLKKNSMHIQIWQMLAEIMTKISCYQIKYQTIHNFYFEFMTKIVSALDRSKQTGSRRNQSQKKNQLNFPILSEPQCIKNRFFRADYESVLILWKYAMETVFILVGTSLLSGFIWTILSIFPSAISVRWWENAEILNSWWKKAQENSTEIWTKFHKAISSWRDWFKFPSYW